MRTRSQKKTKQMARILTYFVLVIAAVICLFPFIWMVSTSFKPMSDIYSRLWVCTVPVQIIKDSVYGALGYHDAADAGHTDSTVSALLQTGNGGYHMAAYYPKLAWGRRVQYLFIYPVLQDSAKGTG